MNWKIRAILCFLLHMSCYGSVVAQLPTASLRTIWPTGGPVGRSTDVVVEGEFLDEVVELRFSDPRISAELKYENGDQGSPKFGNFTVTIPDECDSGCVDVLALGRFGISNSRKFYLSTIPANVVTEARASEQQAQAIAVNSISFARATNSSVDYYKVPLESGQSIAVDVKAFVLDSLMISKLVVESPDGSEIARSSATRTGDVGLQFSATDAGEYVIGVYDALYRGGAEYHYALEVTSDVGRESTQSVVSEQSLVSTNRGDLRATEIQHGDLHAGEKNVVSVPCVVASRFQKGETKPIAIDFESAAGESWVIQTSSASQGAATDPEIRIGRLRIGDGGAETFEQLQHVDDLTLSPGSLLGVVQKDPLVRFVAPEAGLYRILMRDLQTASGPGWSKSFQLEIRRPEPDFELTAMISDPTLDPARARPLGVCMRRGDRLLVEVAVIPKDGFFEPIMLSSRLAGGDLIVKKALAWEWPIQVLIQGLPEGVTAQPLTLDLQNQRGFVVLHASDSAVGWTGPIRVMGKVSLPAELGDGELERTARAVAVQHADPDGRGRALVRTSSDLYLCVTDKESTAIKLSLAESSDPIALKPGEKVEIPVKMERLTDAKNKVVLRAVGLPSGLTANEINLEGDTLTGSLTLTAAPNLPAGDYTILLNGETELPWPRNVQSLERSEAKLAELKAALQDGPAEQQELLAKKIAELEAVVNSLRESTKPQNTRLFTPSNSILLRVTSV